MSGLLARLKMSFERFFMETSYVARIYADALRDNFVSYDPLDRAKFGALQAEFEREVTAAQPHLARLLRIEMGLVDTMPDDVVMARFWVIDDRFHRIVPAATRVRYEASVPKRGDARWTEPGFVRNQMRTLLDVIHTNYLVNIGREQSIKRLKFIIWLALLIVTALALGFMFGFGPGTAASKGYTVVALTGIVGGVLSISNRLQTAVSRDATTEDGIYELTGLRVGWVGIVMSLLMAGGFALVLYVIVVAGLLEIVNPDPGGGARQATAAAVPEKTAPATPVDAIAGAPPVSAAPDKANSATVADTGTLDPKPGVPNVKKGEYAVDIRPDVRIVCSDTAGGVCSADRLGRALGFDGPVAFFKMLILAFLAGFAERLVPDILSRLSKQPAR